MDWEAESGASYNLYWSTDPDFTLDTHAQAAGSGSALNVEPPYLVTDLENRTNWYFIAESASGDAVSPIRGAMPGPLFVADSSQIQAMHAANDQLYIGGRFSTLFHQTDSLMLVQRATGAAAESLGVTGSVQLIVPEGDGWLVGGRMEYEGSQVVLLRVGPDLRVDGDWLVESDGGVSAVHADADRIYLGGSFSGLNGETRHNVAALDRATGELVSDFAPVTDGWVGEIQRYGNHVYIAGGFSARFARLTLDGYTATLDNDLVDFMPAEEMVMAVFNGLLFVGGYLPNPGPDFPPHLVAFDADGRLADFDAGLSGAWDYVGALVAYDDYLYVGGDFSAFAGVESNFVKVDRGLEPSPVLADSAVMLTVPRLQLAEDRLYVLGTVELSGGNLVQGAAEIDRDSGEVMEFRLQPSYPPTGFVPVSQDLFLAGIRVQGSLANGLRHSVFAVLDGNGNLRRDIDLRPADGNRAGEVRGIASDAQGNVYVAGRFDRVREDAVQRASIFSLTPDGVLRAGWAPAVSGGGSTSTVNAVAVVDSTVFAGGGFTTINGISRPYLAALSVAEGSLQGFDAGIAGGSVARLHYVDAAGALLISGGFETVDGTDVEEQLAAAVGLDGKVIGWSPTAGGSFDVISAFASHGTHVVLGGRFSNLDGEAGLNNAAFYEWDETPPTGVATDWKPAPDRWVRSATYHRDVLWLGGDFTEIDGEPQSLLAALTADGSLVPDLAPEIEASSTNARIELLAGFGDYLCLVGQFGTATVNGVLMPGGFGCIDAETGELAW